MDMRTGARPRVNPSRPLRMRVCLASLLLLLAFPLLVSCQQERVPLIEQKCGTCHSADIVYDSRYSEDGWRQVLHGMKIRGLKLTAAEERRVLEILVRDFSE